MHKQEAFNPEGASLLMAMEAAFKVPHVATKNQKNKRFANFCELFAEFSTELSAEFSAEFLVEFTAEFGVELSVEFTA